MELLGSQIQQVVDALLSGYSSKEKLAILVKTRLDLNLDEVCRVGNLKEITFELVIWAIDNGYIDALVNAAKVDSPKNVQIQEAAARYCRLAEMATSDNSFLPIQNYDQLLSQQAKFLRIAMEDYCEHWHRQMDFTDRAVNVPYKGLLNYELVDQSRFFGRDQEILLMTQRIQGNSRSAKVTVLHAPSGAGKTSLVCAGVIPQLSGMISLYTLPRLSKDYEGPEETIRKQILNAYQDASVPPPDFSNINLHRFLKLACAGLNGMPLVIILDQFEYFFIYQTYEEQETFISALADCYDDHALPVKFVLIVRKEYFSDLDNFKSAIPTIFQNSVSLNAFSHEQAVAVLEGAPEQSTIQFESQLVREMLDDLKSSQLGRGRIEPTQLQLVCQHLYQEASSRVIDLKEYESSGRAIGILRAYVARTMQEFSFERRAVVRKMLAALVSKEETKRVLTQLELESETNETNLTALLADLVNARLLRCSESEDSLQYELAHQYLIKEIQEIVSDREWQNKEAYELLERELIKHRMDSDAIISRERLANIETWRSAGMISINSEAESLIEKSQQRHRKEEQKQIDDINFIRMHSLEQLVIGIDSELSSPIAAIRSNSNELRLSIDETKAVLNGLPEMLTEATTSSSAFLEPSPAQMDSEGASLYLQLHSLLEELSKRSKKDVGRSVDNLIRDEGIWHKLEVICDILDEIQDATERMAGLLTTLSNFVQPHQEHKITDVHLQIRNALLLLKGKLYSSGIKLEDKTPYDIPFWLQEAPGQLVFLFMCILLNCIESILRVKSLNFKGTISIVVNKFDEYETIEIIHNGISILNQIEQHHSVSESCTEKYNKDVSFAIAKRIVEKNNGTMIITNLPGLGTSTKLKFPNTNLEKGDEHRHA